MIEFYLNEIRKEECPPFMCRDQHNENENTVSHFTFLGDGQGDFEDRDSTVSREALEGYINYLKEQLILANLCLKDPVRGE